MNAIPSTQLLVRFRARAGCRWIGAHGFEIFCLAPIIVGGVLWVLDRQLTQLREPLARWFSDTGPAPGTTCLAFALLLVATGLPKTLRELYDHRHANGYLDTLPIPEAARFQATLIAELARTLPTCGVLLLAAGALAGELLPSPMILAERVARLLAALLVLTIGRFALALTLVHFRLLTRGRWLVIGGLVLAALAAPEPVRQLLLLPWLAPAAQLHTVFLGALGAPAIEHMATIGLQNLGLTALALYGLARAAYLTWHRRDLEVAALTPSKRPGSKGVARLLEFRDGRAHAVTVQVARDVTLVLRRFSQAVPLAISLALLLDGAVLTILADDRLPDLWRQRLAVAGLTLSVLAMVSLVPFLLKYQLPRFWIEKSTGVDLEQIWKAKLWTAALLAGAPVVAGTLILASAPLDASAKGIAILQLLAAAWVVTSIIGLAVFEIAAQPLLGLLFGSLMGLALSALFVFYPQAWWLWAVFYVYVAGQIAGRATRRVRLLEAEA